MGKEVSSFAAPISQRAAIFPKRYETIEFLNASAISFFLEGFDVGLFHMGKPVKCAGA